ncbi:TetR family transcriptional regulator [Glaciimonas immobilis]|uniref:TetR/AcrR family acrAB operon transcriptional repressor n=1 Tax=Glaciimonas immobilis TaxID=728004 RepID=A0A840RR01_9BURK|nr:TetR family transcriptional regulator [Glaciimonas immobilis]KAF3997461.1 TetR family transcriptional regulator [Glaciimonas immobilis]MBB5200867.1 TetR/AcrR family acrAB operon transcriptional repressor [Glaciimonas immobilis]
MARCTKEEAQETRSRILDAAVEVFYAQGVSQTSLADVATGAGVSRGAIYWHFTNKSDLFNAMCERVKLPMEALIRNSADEGAVDPLGQFRSWCLFALGEGVNNAQTRKIFATILHKCEFVDPTDPIYIRQRECFLEGRVNIQRILRYAVAKGQLPRNLDPILGAIMVQSLLSGVLDNWLFIPESFDLGKQAANIVDLCIHSLKTAPMLQKS